MVSSGGWEPAELDEFVAGAGGVGAAAGKHERGFGVAEEDALVFVAAQNEGGGVEFLEAVHGGFVEGAARAAGATGDDQVEAEVSGVGQVVDQGVQGVAAGGGDQVVVVHEDVDFGAAPPGAVAELLGVTSGPGMRWVT